MKISHRSWVPCYVTENYYSNFLGTGRIENLRTTKQPGGNHACVRKCRGDCEASRNWPRYAFKWFRLSSRVVDMQEKRLPSPNDGVSTVFFYKKRTGTIPSTCYLHTSTKIDGLYFSTVRIRVDPFPTQYTHIWYLANPPNTLQLRRLTDAFETVPRWKWHQHALRDFG